MTDDLTNDGMMFISEPIEPEAGSFSTELMAQGLAGLPGAFTWRNRRYAIVECLEHAKQSSPEASGEVYLRRQEFLVRLDSGQLARLYVLRQAPAGTAPPANSSRTGPSKRVRRQRWFLYTIEPEGSGPANR